MAFGSILLAFFGIGLLIFLHEGGHFLAARLAGVRVEVFSLGFGPRLGGFYWRGTDFRLSAVPFGGYVMVAGQDPSDRRYPRSECLYSKSVSQRLLFWSGGVIMNLLFALIAFPIAFGSGVKFVAPIVGSVPPGAAAWEASILPGERIVEVAGKSVRSFQSQFLEVALNGNRPVELLVQGIDGSERTVTGHPHFDAASGLYGLGLGPSYDAATAVITTVDEKGAAATAGLQVGDLVLSVNGKSPAEPGTIDGWDAHAYKVLRDGKELEFMLVPHASVEGRPAMIGVAPLANRIAGVRPGCGLLDRLDLRRDDHVLAVDGLPFLDGALDRALTGPDLMRWLVMRDGVEVSLEQPAAPAERAQLVEHLAWRAELSLQVTPSEDGAAILAGVQPGDWFVAINGEDLDGWEALRTAVASAGDTPLEIKLLRPAANTLTGLSKASGKVVELTIQPRVSPIPDIGCEYPVAPLMVTIHADSIVEAIKIGTACSVDLIKQMYVTLKRLVTGEVGAKNLSGIVGISQHSYRAAQNGWTYFLWFLAMLSVNLAFVNILPIPVLDGGHLMFLLIEKVKGSPVSTKVFGYSQVIGLVFVLLLLLFVTYNDILRLL
jgi:regulator of sigma E protease